MLIALFDSLAIQLLLLNINRHVLLLLLGAKLLPISLGELRARLWDLLLLFWRLLRHLFLLNRCLGISFRLILWLRLIGRLSRHAALRLLPWQVGCNSIVSLCTLLGCFRGLLVGASRLQCRANLIVIIFIKVKFVDGLIDWLCISVLYLGHRVVLKELWRILVFSLQLVLVCDLCHQLIEVGMLL